MLDVLEKNVYLSQFERLERELASKDPPLLRRLRNEAVDRFAELGFPTSRDEDWKFTNLAPLTSIPFQLPDGRESGRLTQSMLEERVFRCPDCYELVQVNGFRSLELSEFLPTGAVAAGLATTIRQHPEHVEPYLGRYARYEEHPLVALNTAFLQDGAFVAVPKNTVVERPIHLIYYSNPGDEPTVSHPRALIVVGSNSQVTIVESFAGPEGEKYFTNAVTEIVAGENAVIDHYKLQRESRDAYHISTTQVHQSRSSTFTSHYLGFGGRMVRNEVRAVLDAEGCECTLNGLYMIGGTQHADNHTVIDHAKPHCASHELYKGILDGKAHGVFNGKIFVWQDAQKTDAKQTNQTLLLSDDAVINTKPQLEIYADDVKCTHGATVGQLDAEAVFYLRSRGIGAAEARRLLTFAFANDIIRRVRVEPLRDKLEQLLLSSQLLRTESAVQEAS